MRSKFFRVVMLHLTVHLYRCFGTPYQSHL